MPAAARLPRLASVHAVADLSLRAFTTQDVRLLAWVDSEFEQFGVKSPLRPPPGSQWAEPRGARRRRRRGRTRRCELVPAHPRPRRRFPDLQHRHRAASDGARARGRHLGPAGARPADLSAHPGQPGRSWHRRDQPARAEGTGQSWIHPRRSPAGRAVASRRLARHGAVLPAPSRPRAVTDRPALPVSQVDAAPPIRHPSFGLTCETAAGPPVLRRTGRCGTSRRGVSLPRKRNGPQRAQYGMSGPMNGVPDEFQSAPLRNELALERPVGFGATAAPSGATKTLAGATRCGVAATGRWIARRRPAHTLERRALLSP